MVIHLILTTLAGEEVQLTIDLQEYDALQEFENAVLEQLPEHKQHFFRCELDFVATEVGRSHLQTCSSPGVSAKRVRNTSLNWLLTWWCGWK